MDETSDDATRLRALVRSMQRDALPSLVRIHDQDDLRLIHSVILQILERRGDRTVKQLAGHVGRSESHTSRLVDQLVRRHLVERHEDASDRRARLIRLTRPGVELLERLQETKAEAQLELWGYLSEDERQLVLQAMEVFAKAARRLRDDRDGAAGPE